MRRTNTIEIAQDGRDKGKKFLLTEMSAPKAEKWAARVLLALLNSGIELSADEANAGMMGLASVANRGGLKFSGGLQFGEMEPLLDEMMTCVQIAEPALTRALTDDDIEEVATILTLRGEVVKLHTGFSLAERLSEFAQRRKSKA